jgi:hypothetical protein
MPDEWFNIKITAGQLDCIKHYAKPECYLQAVLKAVMADYAERPDDYEHRPPVQVLGMRMIEAKARNQTAWFLDQAVGWCPRASGHFNPCIQGRLGKSPTAQKPV